MDFEEFMLPQARENLQKFWAGAMGAAAKEMKTRMRERDCLCFIILPVNWMDNPGIFKH